MYRSLLKINTNNNYKVYNKIQSNNTRYLIILLVVNKTLTYIKNRNTYVSIALNKANMSKIYFIYFLIFIYEHLQLNKLIRYSSLCDINSYFI